MASPTYALHRIRRNVREKASSPPDPPTKAFDKHRDAYYEIFVEIRILGGDLASDELTDWIITKTTETGALPDPTAVRKQARAICEERDVTLPVDSPLRE